MPVYTYQARRASGEAVTGEMTAASMDDLRRLLLADGILLGQARLSSGGLVQLGGARRAKLSALLSFIREFRSLSQAALPVTEILNLLSKRRDDAVLARAISEVEAEVKKGKSLADAMAGNGDVFDALTQATFSTGAETGNMDAALGQLEYFLTLRDRIGRSVRKAMAYPMFLLALLIVVLAALMLFVLPRFATLYADFGSDLPFATRVLMSAVERAPVWIPVLFVLGVACWVVWRWATRDGAGRRWLDKVKLGLPGIGPVQSDLAYIQICQMMSLLLQAGMPVPQALATTAGSLENSEFASRLFAAGDDVTRGKSLSAAFEAAQIFDDTSRSLIGAGEASGQLESMLRAISTMREQDIDEKIGRMTALIEPVMMILVGLVLGVVIISVYLPIFGLSSVIR